jgi:hypothetical protein
MERRGIRVDARDYLASVEVQARQDRAQHLETFQKWAATKIGADGLALNPASSVQLITFLFGGAPNSKTGELTEDVRVFKVPREEISDAAMEAYRKRDEAQLAKLSPEGTSWWGWDGIIIVRVMKLVLANVRCTMLKPANSIVTCL